MLKSVISETRGNAVPGFDGVGAHHEDEVAIDAPEVLVARMHDEHAHHAHAHLHHFVGVRVVHEGAACLELELVDEGLAGLDMRLGEAADAVHAARNQHAMPMHARVLRKLVGDEDADLVAFDAFDGRAGRLAVIAPQMHGHAGREFALDRLGHQVKFLPVAVHPPRQRPAVQGDDGLIVRTARRNERRLHGVCPGRRRFRNSGGLRAPADRTSAGKKSRRFAESSSGEHVRSPFWSSLSVACFTRSGRQ
jgi:hypothetical protein